MYLDIYWELSITQCGIFWPFAAFCHASSSLDWLRRPSVFGVGRTTRGPPGPPGELLLEFRWGVWTDPRGVSLVPRPRVFGANLCFWKRSKGLDVGFQLVAAVIFLLAGPFCPGPEWGRLPCRGGPYEPKLRSWTVPRRLLSRWPCHRLGSAMVAHG